ncbi:MAG: DNA polymerase III subunit delta [Deltaproteobacteria bacterium]|nr:DNA polymerase III subunit delta [Deltaproteobacteria bacterium]
MTKSKTVSLLNKPASTEKYSPVYAIFGDRQFMKERALSEIRNALLDEITAEFNHEKFDAKETNSSQIVSSCYAVPMMGNIRLIEIRNIDLVPTSELTPFVNYLEKPCDSTCVVFIGDTVDKKKKIFKDFIKYGFLNEFNSGNAAQNMALIKKELTGQGFKFQKNHLQMIVDLIGEQDVGIAIEKLSLLLGESRELDSMVIINTIGTSAQAAVFKFVDSLFERNLAESLLHLKRLKDSNESPIAVINLIARQLRFVIWQKSTSSLHPQARDFMHSTLSRLSKSYSMDELYSRHHAIFKCDLLLKSSSLDSFVLLENLVISWCIHSELYFV